MPYIIQVGDKPSSDILYEYALDLQINWNYAVLHDWLAEFHHQIKGSIATREDNYIIGKLRVLFQVEEDFDLFLSTFDFWAWDRSQQNSY